MTSFSYTTGNPSNLTAGATASMNDIQGPFTDLRTFLNGGNLDETTNVPNLAAAFTTYKTVKTFVGEITSAAIATTYSLSGHSFPSNVTLVGVSAANIFAVKNADFNANSRTTKFRFRLSVATNAVAPAVTYGVGLYPVTGTSGTSGNPPVIATIGAALGVTNSASPASGGVTTVDGSDFTASDNNYAVGIAISGTPAAGSQVAIRVELQVRQV